MQTLLRFATKVANGEVPGLTRATIPKPATQYDDITTLCRIYNEIDLFLWLQRKFPFATNMIEEQTALSRKELALQYLADGLAKVLCLVCILLLLLFFCVYYCL